MIAAAPADILAVPSGGIPGTLVRWGQWLARKPSPAQHVIVVTHQDRLGRWIGIQGEPGGVSLTDCTPRLADPRTRSNHGQPRPGLTALSVFLAACAKSLGLAYDWAGIAEDAVNALCLPIPDLSAAIDHLWRWSPDPADPQLHGEVVCSSLAAMLYDLPQVGWAHPGLDAERTCMPADWYNWNDGQQWTR